MRLLAISGSLRALSSNTATLQAGAILAPPDIEIALYSGLGDLPHFNADLDGDAPPPQVEALRHAIGLCDGVLISSPEYAHGIAGSLKNALDWLVGSLTFPGKPVAVINTAPRATHADAQLREILTTMSARLIEPASITLGIPVGANAAAIAADTNLAAQIRDALGHLAAAVAREKSAREAF